MVQISVRYQLKRILGLLGMLPMALVTGAAGVGYLPGAGRGQLAAGCWLSKDCTSTSIFSP